MPFLIQLSVDLNIEYLLLIDEVRNVLANLRYILSYYQAEMDIQDRQNHLFELIFEGRLFFASIERLDRVLDVGTGTGKWAINFGTEPCLEVEHY